MGRRKKSENGHGEADDATTAAADGERPEARTIEDLSEQERQALFFDHLRKAEPLFEAKKAAAQAIKTAKAIAEEEGVSWKDIELALKAKTPEGEAKLRAEVERQQRVARWMGVSIGTQADMFDDEANGDRAARARAEGQRAGMAGQPCKPPDHYAPGSDAYTAWCDGHADGNEALGRATFKRAAPVDPHVEAGALGTAEPTYAEH